MIPQCLQRLAGDVSMSAPAQKPHRWVWVLVGMTLSPSVACSRQPSVQPPSQVARLMTQLHDQDPAVRQAAAMALGQLGPTAKDAAIQLAKLLKDPVFEVRWAAREALGQLGPAAKDAAPELVKLLKDPDAGVRRDA